MCLISVTLHLELCINCVYYAAMIKSIKIILKSYVSVYNIYKLNGTLTILYESLLIKLHLCSISLGKKFSKITAEY